MSLGLFNCRLIQPAGDQLFFLSAVSPHRCPFARVLFSLLVTHPARPRPAGGRRMLLVFPSQRGFVSAGTPVGCRRSTPVDSPANLPNSTHRFCYGALNPCSAKSQASSDSAVLRPNDAPSRYDSAASLSRRAA